jgi:hypothetical protein
MLPLIKPVIGAIGIVGRELVAMVRLPSTLLGVADTLTAIRQDVDELNQEMRRMRAGVDEIGENTEPVPEQLAQISEGFALLGPELHAINQAVRPLRRARARFSGGAPPQPAGDEASSAA